MTREFDIIDRYFKPLAGVCRSARGLLDDVAVLEADGGHDWLVSTDALFEGVHFFSDDPPKSIASRVLRSNLSDIYAKGGTPFGYSLMCAWPNSITESFIADFSYGLRKEQDLYDLSLIGGDTVHTPGPLGFCVTIYGKILHAKTVGRLGAAVGDGVYVGGTIGDAYLGCLLRQGKLSGMEHEDQEILLNAFFTPDLKPHQAVSVFDYATASIDVSDGLMADAGHLARASHVNLHIDLSRVPTSKAARKAFSFGIKPVDLICGGDDYQILCTAKREHDQALSDAGFVKIGEVEPVEKNIAPRAYLSAQGREVFIAQGGYQHQF